MTNDIKKPLTAKIAELKAEIADINIDWEWEIAKAVVDAQPSFDVDDPMASLEYFSANIEAFDVYQNHKEIADYEETLTMDLAQGENRR